MTPISLFLHVLAVLEVLVLVLVLVLVRVLVLLVVEVVVEVLRPESEQMALHSTV
jgi:hypothetical protein